MEKHSNSNNRRAAYRVTPASPTELELTVLSQRQQLVRAVIDDVAVGGARIRIARALAAQAQLSPGEQITLALRAPRYDYENNMRARVVSVSDDERAQTLHLAFEDQQAETSMPSNEHYALFNRRALQRGVVPTSGVGLEAEVMPSEVTERNMRSYAVGVRNISNVGISLRVGASAHQALSTADELSLALRLPGRNVRRIACQVRHRMFENNDFVYGCEYDWNETIDPLTAAEELLDFVLENAEVK
jgi:PilZ domain